jgi:outer membrane protein assembly factor BamB
VWNYSTGDSFDSSPTVVNDLVYVESRYGNIYSLDSASGGDIYCLDAASGNRVWNFSIGYTASGSSPAVSGGYVYVGNEGGGVYSLDASNGGVVWNVTVGGAVGSPAFSNGYVYLGSTDGNVYCLNASDGAKVWNYTTEYNSNGPSHGYHWGNTVSDPAVAYGKVYVGSSDFLVYCLDASSGNQIWNYTTEAEVYSSPAVAGGCVLAGSYDGNVYCINATSGSEIWSYPAGVFSPVNAGGSAGSPAVAGGVIYVVGNGVIYALATPSTSPSFPLIDIALAAVVAVVVAVTVVYATFAKRKRTATAEPSSALSPSP